VVSVRAVTFRHITGVLLAFGAAVTLSLGVDGRAAASEADDVLVSSDGVVFAPALATPIFGQLELLVPGGELTSTLWIRNPTASASEMRLSAQDITVPSDLYGEAVTLTVSDAASGRSQSHVLGRLARCDLLFPSRTVAADGTVRLDLSLTMGDVTGQDAQNETATLAFGIDMRDARLGPYPPRGCSEGLEQEQEVRDTNEAQRGALAATGRQLPWGLLALAGGLMLAGVLVRATRRREPVDHD
jgi:hypothetical protein